MELIRNMGNCGYVGKLRRITNAIDAAKKYKARLIIVLDTKVYGNNKTIIDEINDYDSDFYKKNIIINGIKFPWWDISIVNVVF